MTVIHLDMAQTVAVAALLLALGQFIHNRVSLLSRYFIPTPIIGGLLFALLALAGRQSGTFGFEFDDDMRSFLLLVFFTTIGFSASLELLKKGGLAVALFLACAVAFVLLQNIVGIVVAKLVGAHPLLGLAAGSISLTGGLGTAAAFGPLLEQAGAEGALPAAIAASTYGLVAGCLIGGPLGSLLMRRYRLQGPRHDASGSQASAAGGPQHVSGKPVELSDDTIMRATILLLVAIGLGTIVVNALTRMDITIPAYLGPMLVAAVFRNIIDWRNLPLPSRQLEVIGNVSLAFFLAMALMSMQLWELADVAGPLLAILLAQTALMALYAYFVTFRVMGRDYDAAMLAAGHCGFALGATSNAMANMQAFARANGPSVKAFFVIPLVGSLFIDFFNAVIITSFLSWMK